VLFGNRKKITLKAFSHMCIELQGKFYLLCQHLYGLSMLAVIGSQFLPQDRAEQGRVHDIIE
jgi:hypothetical protein